MKTILAMCGASQKFLVRENLFSHVLRVPCCLRNPVIIGLHGQTEKTLNSSMVRFPIGHVIGSQCVALLACNSLCRPG